MANNDVKLKHKVQLRRKVESSELGIEASKGESTKSKSLYWWLGGIAALCVVSYFFFQSGEVEQTLTEDATEIVAESFVTEDTLQNGIPVESEAQEEPELSSPETAPTEDVVTDPESQAQTIVTTTVQSTSPISTDVEEEAMKVIRGDYGVGQERKEKLGSKYQSIQNRVNELKREGLF